jgi:hypothetical protein
VKERPVAHRAHTAFIRRNVNDHHHPNPIKPTAVKQDSKQRRHACKEVLEVNHTTAGSEDITSLN